jgi:hypothetical protein
MPVMSVASAQRSHARVYRSADSSSPPVLARHSRYAPVRSRQLGEQPCRRSVVSVQSQARRWPCTRYYATASAGVPPRRRTPAAEPCDRSIRSIALERQPIRTEAETCLCHALDIVHQQAKSLELHAAMRLAQL